VFLLPNDPSDILSQLPCDEVWGVGRRLAPKLRAERILTAQHLRDAADDVLRSLGGVTLLRVAMELRGISCHEERDYDAIPIPSPVPDHSESLLQPKRLSRNPSLRLPRRLPPNFADTGF
jgi:nucleotidyltransferase/DNA polymerase involved in DNA repair